MRDSSIQFSTSLAIATHQVSSLIMYMSHQYVKFWVKFFNHELNQNYASHRRCCVLLTRFQKTSNLRFVFVFFENPEVLQDCNDRPGPRPSPGTSPHRKREWGGPWNGEIRVLKNVKILQSSSRRLLKLECQSLWAARIQVRIHQIHEIQELKIRFSRKCVLHTHMFKY